MSQKIFITGGAGFIGCNSAHYFLERGYEITIFDNLSRRGGASNLNWLRAEYGGRFKFVKGDIRDPDHLADEVSGADVVLHLASQVAVTSSVENPREDFEINAFGTFNVLEAVRNHNPEAIFIYASTNKVYGALDHVRIDEGDTAYAFSDFTWGIPESFPLDFHSPYGCSKGTGDQYTIDYARIYGLRTLVFRQSCIFGRRQFGIEDQGWIAHFIIAACRQRPITIFGNGKQVRDVLHVSDLIRAYEAGIERIDDVCGSTFNIGGGSENTLSIWNEFKSILEELHGRQIEVTFADWRPGDQKVFIADIRRAKSRLGWQPHVSPREGISDLYEWVSENSELFS